MPRPRLSKASGTKMEQRSAETRARIVRAAYDLFCERGFRAATMEAVGTAGGVSVQTVYFQFRTKDQVLRAGWSQRLWVSWVSETLTDQLFGAPG